MNSTRRVPAAIALGVAALAISGCSTHLAGTNDAALEYATDAAGDVAPGVVRGAASRIKARLSSALLAADVDVTSGHRVRVVVDADFATTADSLVLWRGGLHIYLADHAHATVGAAESFPPLVELGPGGEPFSVAPATDRRAISVTTSPTALFPVRKARLADLTANVLVIRDRTLLASIPIGHALESPLIVPFGRDVTAYARAERTRRLLASPDLPPMHRLAATRLASRWDLAASSVLLPFFLSFAWLLFVRRFDRARPEPMWLVSLTFALGALSGVPAALAETGLAHVTPYLDPSVMTLGGQIWALPVSIIVFTITVGAIEEGAKWLAAWSVASHRPEFDEPVDGIIYACAASLGFAAAENLKYFAMDRMSASVIAVRAFITVPAHMFFGAIWGYAMGRRLATRETPVAAFIALAALAHGAFDATLSVDGLQTLATPLVLSMALVFVFLLRRTLRYGPVGEEPRRGQADAAYFRVGSPVAFYVSAAAMVGSAVALVAVGSDFERLHHRVGAPFIVTASILLGIFGLFAFVASETITLDVVLDSEGITFAGGRTPWSAIDGVDPPEPRGAARGFVMLRAARGNVRLGPAPRGRAILLADAIEARLAEARASDVTSARSYPPAAPGR